MTPNLAVIRANLNGDTYAEPILLQAWMRDLCAEVERLRAERINETGKSAEMYEQLHREVERLRPEGSRAIANLAGALLEIDSLNEDLDAALAENERIRTATRTVINTQFDLLVAWRACADQLADRIRAIEHGPWLPKDKEALAVYERLKADQ